MKRSDYVNMRPIPVTSARIASLVHAGGTLYVEFKRTKRVYSCTPVSTDMVKVILSSPSIGRAYESMIANNPNVNVREVLITED
jgi:hypothetical protein